MIMPTWPARLDEVQLIALAGPPGSGKTSLRNQLLRDVPAVHLDGVRAAVSPWRCEADQAVTGVAAHMAMVQTAGLLAAGRRVVWDATNAMRADRLALQVLAAEFGVRTAMVILLPELEVCLERNRSRDARLCPCGFARRVPEEIVAEMHAALTRDLPTLPGEGWDHVVQTSALAGVPGTGAAR